MRTVDRLIDTLRQELSGERALDTVGAVVRYNRIVGSTAYAAAVNALRTQLAAYRVDEVVIESFPIDGKQSYAGYTFGPAWEPHSARLELLAPERYVIADFEITPMCLPAGCPPTPPDGIIAAVVDVGAGDRLQDYQGIDVRGKAVLATGLTTTVYTLAVEEFGAACVMTTNLYEWSNLPEIQRTLLDLPDATHLARLYFDAEKQRTSQVFSITHRHAEHLRALARHGPVTVQATVAAETKPGLLQAVVATIHGTDLADQEVWLLAHLCHPKPGACDNASGVALGIEILRTLASLIRSGALPRPRRTLRLLLVPEISGTAAYMDRHQARMDKVAAAINLDMVGAGYTTGAYCRLLQTPWSRPSFLNRLAEYVLEKVSLGSRSHMSNAPVRNWLYAVAPYDKGSDHDVMLNSIYAIPSLFFFSWPYRYYHTDYDTPDKLDPQELARVGLVAGALAWVAANLDTDLAASLLKLIYTEANREINLLAEDLGPALPYTKGAEATTRSSRIWAVGEREKGALRSVLMALPRAEQLLFARTAARLETDLDRVLMMYTANIEASESLATDWTPRRLEPWPLSFDTLQNKIVDGQQRLQMLREVVTDFDDKAIEALNYVDAKRSLAQIARLVTGELGPFPLASVSVYFEWLVEAGVVVRSG